MNPADDDAINQLLKELADAKDWPVRLRERLKSGSDIGDELREAERAVETLEKRSQEAMKQLGCVSPRTRPLYRGMADMLISWNSFKDSLE